MSSEQDVEKALKHGNGLSLKGLAAGIPIVAYAHHNARKKGREAGNKNTDDAANDLGKSLAIGAGGLGGLGALIGAKRGLEYTDILNKATQKQKSKLIGGLRGGGKGALLGGLVGGGLATMGYHSGVEDSVDTKNARRLREMSLRANKNI